MVASREDTAGRVEVESLVPHSCLPFWGCFAARVDLASGLLPALHSLDIRERLVRAISPGMIFGDRVWGELEGGVRVFETENWVSRNLRYRVSANLRISVWETSNFILDRVGANARLFATSFTATTRIRCFKTLCTGWRRDWIILWRKLPTYKCGEFGIVKMGNESYSKIARIRDVCFETDLGNKLMLKDLRHVPGLRLNLMSTGVLDREGFHHHGGDQKWRLTKGSLVVAREKLCCTIYKTYGKIWKRKLNVTDDSSPSLWHKQLGHVSEKGLQVLAKKSLIPFLKDQVFQTFKVFDAMVEREMGRTLKCLRSDNGGEYTLNEFRGRFAESFGKFSLEVVPAGLTSGFRVKFGTALDSWYQSGSDTIVTSQDPFRRNTILSALGPPTLTVLFPAAQEQLPSRSPILGLLSHHHA
ncbi:hypothetical protein ACLB2K_077402 [Fragaria x ananassa]